MHLERLKEIANERSKSPKRWCFDSQKAYWIISRFKVSAVAAESMNASFTSRNHLRRCLQAMSLTEKFVSKPRKREKEQERRRVKHELFRRKVIEINYKSSRRFKSRLMRETRKMLLRTQLCVRWRCNNPMNEAGNACRVDVTSNSDRAFLTEWNYQDVTKVHVKLFKGKTFVAKARRFAQFAVIPTSDTIAATSMNNSKRRIIRLSHRRWRNIRTVPFNYRFSGCTQLTWRRTRCGNYSQKQTWMCHPSVAQAPRKKITPPNWRVIKVKDKYKFRHVIQSSSKICFHYNETIMPTRCDNNARCDIIRHWHFHACKTFQTIETSTDFTHNSWRFSQFRCESTRRDAIEISHYKSSTEDAYKSRTWLRQPTAHHQMML